MSDLPFSSPIAWVGTPGYKVCVALAAPTVPEMMERANGRLAEHAFVELRLDSLAVPMLLPEALPALLQKHPGARLIATCRRREGGGGFAGSVDEELAVLAAAAHAGCSIVDLELETAEQMRPEQHHTFRQALRAAGTALLVSYHDWDQTRDLSQTVARLQRQEPEILKIVSTATMLSDSLPMLRLLGSEPGTAMVGIAMGEAGIVSRVLGPCNGSLFTFAAASAGRETAAGQVALSTLRDLYRLDQISKATRVYGVAGKPIAHSLSPLLHNTAFQVSRVDAVFLPLLTESVEDLLHLVRELPMHGLSITMPLKQAILPLLDRVDPLAARVGACNTVVRTATGALHGYNTDVAGVIAPLAKRLPLKGARVLVKGAGGAARAAVFGLRDEGADVWVWNRTRETAAALAAEAGAGIAETPLLHTAHFDVLINATPSGMLGACPGDVSAATADDKGPAGAEAWTEEDAPLPADVIFDMVYRPLETALIRKARAEKRAVITGVEMFVHQGARQFELWTGETAPQAEMLRVILEELDGAW